MKNKLIKTAFVFDAALNLLLGIALIFFHATIEALLSPSQVMSRGLWIFIGLCLLLYGIWQSVIYYLNRINKKVELISGLIAWILFLVLSYALLFIDLDLFPTAFIILWIMNFYILSGGFFFFWAYKQSG